jgi:hypothetical protein
MPLEVVAADLKWFKRNFLKFMQSFGRKHFEWNDIKRTTICHDRKGFQPNENLKRLEQCPI